MDIDDPRHTKDYLKEIGKCVRCGRCKASCPTYHEDPIEPMGARGRIALLRGLAKGEVNPSSPLNRYIYSCIACNACSGTCPLGINIPRAIYQGRALLRKSDRRRLPLRYLTKLSIKWPDAACKIARLGQHTVLPFLSRRGIIPELPEIPAVPFRKTDQVFKSHRKKQGRVAVFTGCSINYLFPHYGEALLHVLQKLNYEVVFPKGETCCGNPLRSLGLEDEAVIQAKKNHRVFSRLKVDAILSLCPTCTSTLKHDYAEMIGKGLEKAEDISVFLKDRLGPVPSAGNRVVYHDPCHLQYALGVKTEPRVIIKKAGVELVEAQDPGCCGFGGLYCVSNMQMAGSFLKRRAADASVADSDALVTSCPGCVIQLGRVIKDKPVIHLIELIEEAYCLRGEVQERLF